MCSCASQRNDASYVRFGSKADMCAAKRHVSFTPNSDIDCVFPHVRFGPIADTQDCNEAPPFRNSNEHSSAGQYNADFGELARLRINLD